MVHGAPDNSNIQQKIITYRLDDMSELAVRLNAPPSVDRLGEVIFLEEFENGRDRWKEILGGSGGSTSLTGTMYRTGGFCYKTISGTGSYAGLNTFLMYPILSKMGFEFWYTIHSMTDYILLFIDIYDGSVLYQPAVKIDRTNSKIYIYDDTGTYIEVDSSLQIISNPALFHGCKLVVDLDSGVYSKLTVNDNRYDLSSYNIYNAGSTTNKTMRFYLYNYAKSGQKTTVYFDDIIVTQNEP